MMLIMSERDASHAKISPVSVTLANPTVVLSLPDLDGQGSACSLHGAVFERLQDRRTSGCDM
jgi:hypothetical protein